MTVTTTAVLLTATVLAPHALEAQRANTGPAAAARTGKAVPARPSDGITGRYVGTATVPLGDSTIVVPVTYVFTGVAPAIGGTAVVPGQGSGAISNVVREGNRLRFRVLASQPQGKGPGTVLEHDGTIAADGSIEGFVNLDGKPVAKFRIAPGATRGAPGARPGAPETPRSTRDNTR